jgi:hypothetical protein
MMLLYVTVLINVDDTGNKRKEIILWRIDPLLSSDLVNNDRCQVTPATYTLVTIEERRFLCGPRHDRCYAIPR